MDTTGICYFRYWFQIGVKDNFSRHLVLIKSHYYIESHLELVKHSNSSTSLEVGRICPSIESANGLEIQVNIFKITMKSNATLEYIGCFRHLEAFIFGMFLVAKDSISASAGVSGR
jgi:hypothetical protein